MHCIPSVSKKSFVWWLPIYRTMWALFGQGIDTYISAAFDLIFSHADRLGLDNFLLNQRWFSSESTPIWLMFLTHAGKWIFQPFYAGRLFWVRRHWKAWISCSKTFHWVGLPTSSEWRTAPLTDLLFSHGPRDPRLLSSHLGISRLHISCSNELKVHVPWSRVLCAGHSAPCSRGGMSLLRYHRKQEVCPSKDAKLRANESYPQQRQLRRRKFQ